MSSTAAIEQESTMDFDVESVRAQFPALQQEVNGRPLIYLDSAATTQKPKAVIDAITHYYQCDNANVHRAAHALSSRATSAFEASRQLVADFLGSPDPAQVIWVRGVTEAVNLVAYSWGRSNLNAGDRVLVSTLEHHSDIVPWQLVCAERGAEVVAIPVSDEGVIDQAAYDELLDERVKMVAVNHVSNALGTVNPVKEMVAKAKAAGALCMVDGAQAVAHWPLDVIDLGCDFYAFSGHKLFGPTGVGALWGRRKLLEAMPPFFGGGEMIDRVSFDGTTFNTIPFKFEAGTPHIAGVIGLGAAVKWVQSLDRDAAAAHEAQLLAHCDELAQEIPGLRRLGPDTNRIGVFSFLLEGTHPEDLGTLLDQQGIAIRTGHHCAQPLMSRFDIPGSARASFSLYNTMADVEALFTGLRKVQELFA
ncbi:MAG TPA: cysteine desulfurase CsdA [Gammaproteobacteria bacterium]|nr:cysteine desulfurase CsdA [Gammaproteobacteria bacterium]RPG43590.1 MAG: cysteine desulfurase [Gammaproteobacteria bacterium TMED163]HAO88031.1 cysteine desulfurase CsdA [Gammaproteobacteria bacterium]HAR89404.1 cysteine desulfurase CsdA [Gammaproteobacteria bacterium]HAU23402.1 cysteine desulfurase CsdA [Gammaproteobacteria bacterium]|tara:strand:+ start:1328 stop:2584 length:1257 start_codon:yes stop_codon:yes gene_type:complete